MFVPVLQVAHILLYFRFTLEWVNVRFDVTGKDCVRVQGRLMFGYKEG